MTRQSQSSMGEKENFKFKMEDEPKLWTNSSSSNLEIISNSENHCDE